MRNRARVLGALIVLSLAFYAGTRLFVRPAPPIHPLTGRQIAGIATDSTWMDRTERQQEEEPDRALDLIAIQPGMKVADVGAGSGYMTTRLSPRVGPTGKVYANDVQPALLQIIRQKASSQGLSNIELVLGTETDARLPEGAIDLVLLVDVYHEFSHPQEMLRSIRRSLKPEGRLVLIEYRKEDPSIPIADTHRLNAADARKEIGAEGFTFDQLISRLPRQHIIVFRR
jgi:ubiquinone/menaquinone biosynthesis C-methylase UbiE